jgi:CRP/FNR family transcriptional regulator, cyclic AMP receptor protein
MLRALRPMAERGYGRITAVTTHAPESTAGFEALAYQALSRSLLAGVPEQVLFELIRDATRLNIPERRVIYRAGDDERCGLIVSGLLRQYLVHSDGREVTLRYAGSGIFAGAVIVVSGPTQSWAQAVVDTTMLILDVEKVRDIAQRHAGVAWAMAQEIARTHRELLRSMADTAFGSIRQRAARHILDLALTQGSTRDGGQPLPSLVAHVTQQELAGAVGSVREVVSRVLRDLRAEGLIESQPGAIAVLDPIRLGKEANFEV